MTHATGSRTPVLLTVIPEDGDAGEITLYDSRGEELTGPCVHCGSRERMARQETVYCANCKRRATDEFTTGYPLRQPRILMTQVTDTDGNVGALVNNYVMRPTAEQAIALGRALIEAGERMKDNA